MSRPLMIALAAVLGLALWFSFQDEGGTVEPARQQGARGNHVAAAQPGRGASERGQAHVRDDGPSADEREALVDGVARWALRQAETVAVREPAKAWAPAVPPPPPVVAPPPPPPPMAPRFPHQWIGRINDEMNVATAVAPKPSGAAASGASSSLGQRASEPVQRAVIAGRDATWVVRVGDVIEGQWRVDRIDGRSMSLTYLPLQQVQTIAMK